MEHVSVLICAHIDRPHPLLSISSGSFARQFLCLFLSPVLVIAVYLMISFSSQSAALYRGFLPLPFIGILSPVKRLLWTIFHCQESVLELLLFENCADLSFLTVVTQNSPSSGSDRGVVEFIWKGDLFV